MAIIVVEGMDGAGKTTLIEKARGNQKDRYFITLRASRYQPTVQDAIAYNTWIKRQSEINLVLDRFHFISDRVYGPILRGEDVFKDFPITYGLKSVAEIVYCRPPLERVLDNARKGSHLEGVAERAEKLYDGYDKLMHQLKSLGMPINYYDFTQDDATSFWKYIWSRI